MKGNILCMTLNFFLNQNRQWYLFIEGITFSSIMKINKWEKNAGWAVENRINVLTRVKWPATRTQCNKLQITLKSLLGKHFCGEHWAIISLYTSGLHVMNVGETTTHGCVSGTGDELKKTKQTPVASPASKPTVSFNIFYTEKIVHMIHQCSGFVLL